MRAAVFRAPGAPLEIASAPDPVAGAGEVIVRVKNCGVCGSDLHAAGSQKLKLPAGTIMGHEFAGVIDEVGAGVTGFSAGDAVAGMSMVACGGCAMCRSGAAVRCLAAKPLGFGEVAGAFAELVKTRPGSLYKVPATISFRAAATVEPLVVGLHGLRRARFQAGDSALIMGGGTIGLVTLLWARFAGAGAIVVSEVLLPRRDLALKLGADGAVDPRMRNPAAEMVRLSGAPPDVVFECIGAPGTLAQAIDYAARGGRVAVLGASMEDDGFAPGAAMSRELEIYFSLGLEVGEVETTIAALAAGRIASEAMITHTVALEELPRAFAAMAESGLPGKLMLEF
ncbi:MAG TPA: alcohol dehydrogenase catalytic domain-containing protein [Candidatus Binataceae bacterium]|nr:alcohol dehydrogenase catalytic domain-containing protein [Candidatus Binataceae bacterium]